MFNQKQVNDQYWYQQRTRQPFNYLVMREAPEEPKRIEVPPPAKGTPARTAYDAALQRVRTFTPPQHPLPKLSEILYLAADECLHDGVTNTPFEKEHIVARTCCGATQNACRLYYGYQKMPTLPPIGPNGLYSRPYNQEENELIHRNNTASIKGVSYWSTYLKPFLRTLDSTGDRDDNFQDVGKTIPEQQQARYSYLIFCAELAEEEGW